MSDGNNMDEAAKIAENLTFEIIKDGVSEVNTVNVAAPEPITEETHKELIDSWFQSVEGESIDDFINELNTKYAHDYGTICHAVAAEAIS